MQTSDKIIRGLQFADNLYMCFLVNRFHVIILIFVTSDILYPTLMIIKVCNLLNKGGINPYLNAIGCGIRWDGNFFN